MSIRDVIDAAREQNEALQPKIKRTVALLAIMHPSSTATTLLSMQMLLNRAHENVLGGFTQEGLRGIDTVLALLSALTGGDGD